MFGGGNTQDRRMIMRGDTCSASGFGTVPPPPRAAGHPGAGHPGAGHPECGLFRVIGRWCG